MTTTSNDPRWEYAIHNGRKVHSKCKFCGQPPTPEGYDHCIGELPGVLHACCGHGVEPSMVRFTNRVVIRGKFDVDHLNLTEEQKKRWKRTNAGG